MRISHYALLGTLALCSSLIGVTAAHATGACECTECELASGTTTYEYQYDADSEDSMQAGLAAQHKVKKMAKKEASDLSKKGPLCEAPCEPSHVSYFVEPPSFMSTSSAGGYGEAKARWRITGSCLKKKAGLNLGIGIGIGVGGDDHRDDRRDDNQKPPRQEQTQPPH
ncbi:MAG: hypothetical protein HY243_14665 [Proteobacteria bacterium]|nr:hypothetical protein [Pseudomonadota bacterium]